MTRTQHGHSSGSVCVAEPVVEPEPPAPRPHGRAAVIRPAPVSARADGPAAVIRPARAADAAALGEFFAGLSQQSRYLRFFGPVTPGPALLRRLAGDAEGVEAVVAVRGRLIIGHAMAADRPGTLGQPGCRAADIGVVVADAWQGRGVGAALMRALVTGAQARGLTSMTMDVLPGNRQVIAMILAHWPAARIDRTPDGLTIRIRLRLQHQQPSAATA
jgi:ribosomal protein S18 acetylase RimI-like enzyme